MTELTAPSPFVSKLAQLAASDGFWRLIDAYTPRVFGLLFHSYLLVSFGAAQYAFPGWVLGSFGLLLAALPDPHSYILVRANGARAHRLSALCVPAVLAKLALAGAIALVCVVVFASDKMTTVFDGTWIWVALASILYGGTEFLWAVLGTVSLSTGQVRRVAIWGLLARGLSVGALVSLWHIGGGTLATYLSLAALPVIGAWAYLSPKSWRLRRAWRFFSKAVRTYAGWVQGISLITVGLFQLPTLALGMWSGSDAALVGFVAFGSRLLQAGFQPFQILQSVVIRDASAAHRAGLSHARSFLWTLFKTGGAGFAIVTALALIVAFAQGIIAQNSLVLGVAMSLGIALSIWFRYELAQTLATRAARSIFLYGYAPVFVLAVVATPACLALFGVNGLAIVVFLGWAGLSNSWRWIA